MKFLRPVVYGSLAISVFALCSPRARGAGPALPSNLSGGLRRMVEWYQTEAVSHPVAERRALLAKTHPAESGHAQVDETASAVVVNVILNGALPLADVEASLFKLGVSVFARNDIGGSGSVLSARLPLDHAVEAAQLPGVHALMLVRRPHNHVGRVTSQGAGVLKTNLVNAMGYTGAGITVGVLSDSYNLVVPSAAADVLFGDLPGTGNPLGHTQPVFVLAEGNRADPTNTDEGRAMLQIVHDLAPGASLAFATAGLSPESFATNIRALRVNPAANCDVMVDDITYPDEPFFSDGVIAQAIDDVVHSTSLPGKRVAYYTAAGNSSNGVYIGDFNPVSDAVARAGLPNTNVKLDQVPPVLTAGGFHNYNTRKRKAPIIVQRITIKGGGTPSTGTSNVVELTFQWDDPTIPNLITTDYNLLVFDANGNYRGDLSGTDNNFNTGMPLEFTDLQPNADGSDAEWQLVISRTAQGAGGAVHLRNIAYSESNLYETDNFTTTATPSVFGHQAAPGGDGVAAYDYTKLAEPEDYSSVGPMTVYFDRAGNRLPVPEVRLQPTLAAPDGVDTTFFPAGPGQDTDQDGFPNFFGTSAAAPHAAGVAALLLQAGGGPGSLSADQVRALLQSTAGPHDLDPSFAAATVINSDGLATTTLSASGDGSDNSAHDPKFFQLSFAGPPTRSIRRVSIDLTATNREFDPTVASGLPFTISARGSTIPASAVTAIFSGPDAAHPYVLTLKFQPGVFLSGGTFSFGVDRDDTSTHAGGNSADGLANAMVIVKTSDSNGAGGKGRGVITNHVGFGNTFVDGYGLINAEAALNKLLGR